MPSYADDDAIDYENEMPDFQDEAEFDDYLNDEEYQLMTDLFPQAKKELQDFQGWDNLAVKLAIFDFDFNLDEALDDLKKTYKKKKIQITAPSKPPAAEKGMYYNSILIAQNLTPSFTLPFHSHLKCVNLPYSLCH